MEEIIDLEEFVGRASTIALFFGLSVVNILN
jgi:hypothetical protein